MSWLRAIVSGLVIVAVAFAFLVYIPDLILSQVAGLDRGGRVALATGWFVLSLVGLLWGLRRLQNSRLI